MNMWKKPVVIKFKKFNSFLAMTSVAVANSFHFVTDGGESKPLNDFPIISLTVSGFFKYF